ncbi:MAG TPA: hypothetical protein VFB80_20600 [Pirellulaceae bacterium]|nr:hypothetical protein [Pirellulaceae bacterium]
MEPNPYESPRTGKPLSGVNVAKRSLALAILLLLTPPAMAIAVFGSCKALYVFPSDLLGIAYVFPFLVLAGLMIAGAVLWWPRQDVPATKEHRVGLLLATPFAVAAATAVGFGLAVVGYFCAGRPGGNMIPGGEMLVLLVFWLPPTGTLLYMLWLAWRHRFRSQPQR